MRLNGLQRGFDTAAHTETDTPTDSTGPGAESDIYVCDPMHPGIGNESAPIQLAQRWFPGLAISNAKT